jgi:hypothetical protein
MRLCFPGAVGAILVLGAAPSTASADLVDETISSSEAQPRVCQARTAAGAGVVQRRVTATASGLIRARLSGEGSGDWDLGVFDTLTGRSVAGSASFGLRELAEGVAAKGQALTVQACRRSGSAGTVRLSVQSVPLPAPTGARIQLVRVSVPNEGSRAALESLGLDLTEHARPGFQDVMVYGSGELLELTRAGLGYVVVVPDVVAADRAALNASVPGDLQPLPSGRTSYRRLPDYGSDMKRLAEENPALVKPITLNHPSLEGRAVEGIEISRDVAADDGKPVFLQMGVHHAREWPSGEMPLEFAFELVQKFNAGDQRTVDLLGRTRVIVVPIVNPDGFNLSREAPIDSLQPVVDPGFAYKRRNCRVQDFAFPAPGECGQQANRNLGVDPNRNYGGFWGGPGASSSPSNDTYRGSGPFSEPESQNVRELVSSRQVTTLITNHTYSDLVLRPPGLASQGDPPDEPVYKDLGDSMAAENGYTSQKSWELYDTTGTTEDWSYYATGGLGFTFEIGKASDANTLVGVGFHPPFPAGVVTEYYGKYPTGGGNREAYYKALASTADTTRHSVLEGTAPAGAVLRAGKAFTTSTSPVIGSDGTTSAPITFPDVLDTRMTVGADGTFDWHLNPSTRPAVVRERRTSLPAAEPAWTQDISSADPVLPPAAGTRDIQFEVPADASRQIKAVLDGADGDDYDIYLYKGAGAAGAPIASSAGATADEVVVYDNAAPGTYTLQIANYAATQGYRGAISLYGIEPGSEQVIPAGVEAWTVTCERADGRVLGSQEVVIARGERKALFPCGGRKGSGKKPRG